jgi:polyhydroxyalkanoate synthesis regulator phasin
MSEDGIEDVKEKLNVSDLEDATKETVLTINDLVADGELTDEQIAAIVESIPKFIELQEEVVEGLREVASEAGESQRAAIEAVRSSLDGLEDTLQILAESAESDEARLEIAKLIRELSEKSVEVADKVERMNKENNRTWAQIAGAVSSTIAAGVAIYLANR